MDDLGEVGEVKLRCWYSGYDWVGGWVVFVVVKVCLVIFIGVREGNYRFIRKLVYDYAIMRMGVERDRGKFRNENL